MMTLPVRSRRPRTLREGPPLRVLVVEDNDDLRNCIREVFQMRGFAVETSGNGLDAVDLVRRHDFDTVVCDVRLPGLSGLSVVRALNGMPRPPRSVLMTAYPSWKVMEEAREVGAGRVLTKPLDLRKLADLVARSSDAGEPKEENA